MEKKGISLVALVITIIVLIILTGAVIATFMEGGIIDKSKQAVMKSDCATLQEVYNLKYNTAKIEVATGNGGEIDKLEVLKETVDEIGIKGFDFTTKYLYTGDNKEIMTWVLNNFLFEDISKSGYIISLVEGELYLTGINYPIEYSTTVKVTIGDLKQELGEGYTIKNATGNLAQSDERITTGCIIENEEGDKITIVIKGDTTSEGWINVSSFTPIGQVLGDGIEKNLERGVTMSEILACDVNSDGYISSDDINFLNTNIKLTQNFGISSLPKVKKGDTIYTWYTTDDIYQKLTQAGYKVENGNITVKNELTYGQLENEFRRIFKTNDITFHERTDREAIVENGGSIHVNMPGKISENIYTQVGSFRLKIVK